MTSDSTAECALALLLCSRHWARLCRQPNAVNRFAYSKREVLFAT
jgi:hypothetical protein